MDNTQFTQQKRAPYLGKLKLSFNFGEDELTYTVSDSTGGKTVLIPYEIIPLKSQETIQQKPALSPTFLITLVIAALAFALLMFMHGQAGEGTGIAIGGTLGGIILFMRHGGAIKFSVYLTNMARLRVIHDQQFDAITSQLKAHIIAKLRKLHASINPANSVEKEIAKFEWLKKNDVISEQEYQNNIAKLRQTKDASKSLPGEKPLN